MLPLEHAWYRRLLWVAIVLGGASGLLGLAYLGATGAITDTIFDADDSGWWSGTWWWIAVTAAGGLVVAALRVAWAVPDDTLGGVEMIERATVDHRTALRWIAPAAMSSIAGASLGPSFALILIGGGLGSSIAARRSTPGTTGQDYTLTGIAGGFGGAFTAPMLGAFMVSELAPSPRSRRAVGCRRSPRSLTRLCHHLRGVFHGSGDTNGMGAIRGGATGRLGGLMPACRWRVASDSGGTELGSR